MKLEISNEVLKESSFFTVVCKDINNRTSRSRDIVLRLEKLKGKKKFSNINPFVNFFTLYLQEFGFDGFYAGLEGVYGDLELGFLEKEMPFLKVGGKEVEFCEARELVLYDQHSVAYRLQEGSQGERVKVAGNTKNVIVCFYGESGDTEPLQQSAFQFAREGKELFGGSWEVFENSPVEIDYKPLELDGNLDAVSDLKKLVDSGVKGSKGVKKRRGDSLGFVNEDTMLGELNAFVASSLSGFGLENRSFLSKSPNFKFGHFSTNIAFEISKTSGKKVVDVAEDIAMKLKGETRVDNYFSRIEVAKNGFVNFFLSDEYLLSYAKKSLSDFEKFSSCGIGKGRVILIESPSANPNKAMHLGHLLNVFLAQSLKEVFQKLGFVVYNDNIINDKGLPISKTIWAIKNFANDSSPEKESLKSDHFVDKYYVLGAQKFKESKEVEKEVRDISKKLEDGDTEIVALWKKMISWALEGQRETMKNLGEEMGHTWFESDLYEIGRDIVKKSIDGEKIVETSDGAVVGKIEEEYGVPDVVLLKSDGTSLYHTQDIALTKLKVEKFNPWLAIWVVGNEQIAHFQRLFSLIDSLGLLPIDNLYHLAYGYVFDKDGKRMSSRSGEALSADGLLEMVEESTGNRDVTLGALKYAFLSSDAFKDMKFDLDEAVRFNGKSGPYVMYAHARACNILKDVKGDDVAKAKFSDLNREILLKCLDYPNVIVSCANSYSPSVLAEYLYDLSKLFSQMYETESVLEAEGDEKLMRIFVVKFVREVLKDGLETLRINALERM